jgi:anti-sigma regulatory factor (Ser/Thr protein kinase)
VSPATCDDASLVVSELVTNALSHGEGDIVVQSRVEDHDVHVAVTDGGGGQPELMAPPPGHIGGVGLRLVDHLSARWGVAPANNGKTVWATLHDASD